MNRTFDFYEYAGIIVPGAVLIIGLLLVFPDARSTFSKEGVTFGELGLFVLLAYATGHIVQALGNMIEWIWWKPWGGMPGKRLLAGHYLSPAQRERLSAAVKADQRLNRSLEDLTPAERDGLVRETYVLVSKAGAAARVDIFNGNYGLLRGLSASLLVILVLVSVKTQNLLTVAPIALALALAIHRMHRFAVRFAIELFLQYLLVASITAVSTSGASMAAASSGGDCGALQAAMDQRPSVTPTQAHEPA